MIEKGIEQGIITANFYDRFSDEKAEVKRYLTNNAISLVDTILLVIDMKKEIDIIQDKQDEDQYNYELSRGKDVKPRRVEIILGRRTVQDAENMTEDKIIEAPDVAHNAIKNMALIGYKYQLKYSIIILEEMISDKDIWGDIVFH